MMPSPPSRKQLQVLARVKRLAKKEDWEAGDVETFAALLQRDAANLPGVISDAFLQKLVREVQDFHQRERGSAEEFNDIARQQWLAELLTLAMERTVNAREEAAVTRVSSSRKALLLQIETLILALNENVDVVTKLRNSPPALDLDLRDDVTFLQEIKQLIEVLQALQRELGSRRSRVSAPAVSIATTALNRFVLKLAGAAGEGLGKTISWGSRIAMALLAIGILREFGFPVENLFQLAKTTAFGK